MGEAPQEPDFCWYCGGDWDVCKHDPTHDKTLHDWEDWSRTTLGMTRRCLRCGIRDDGKGNVGEPCRPDTDTPIERAIAAGIQAERYNGRIFPASNGRDYTAAKHVLKALEQAGYSVLRVLTPQSPESHLLHPEHRWGQRPILERTAPSSNVLREKKIFCCLDCLVDGYEDQPDAFLPCKRPGRHKKDGKK